MIRIISWLGLSLSFVLCFTSCFGQDDLDFSKLLPKEIDTSQIFVSDSSYTWCNSIIKGEDNKYHMFYSRWPHGKRNLDDDKMNYIFDGFNGWLKYSEIAYAISDHPNGPYHYVKTILKGDGDPNKWDRYTMHNPQIRKFKDTYYLYYISNSYDPDFVVTNKTVTKDWATWLKYNCTQKVGVIKAKSIKDLVAGNFQKTQQPLIEPDHINTFEVTTNPSVTEGPDGKYYMIYKSRKPNVGNMTMWMAKSDAPDLPFKLMSQVFTEPNMSCEDPFLWYDKKRKRFYAAVKYYSNSKFLVPQFGALALITSENGIDWQPGKYPLISLRQLKLINKPMMELAHLERPFIMFDNNGDPQTLCVAAAILKPNRDGSAIDFEHNTFSICFNLE